MLFEERRALPAASRWCWTARCAWPAARRRVARWSCTASVRASCAWSRPAGCSAARRCLRTAWPPAPTRLLLLSPAGFEQLDGARAVPPLRVRRLRRPAGRSDEPGRGGGLPAPGPAAGRRAARPRPDGAGHAPGAGRRTGHRARDRDPAAQALRARRLGAMARERIELRDAAALRALAAGDGRPVTQVTDRSADALRILPAMPRGWPRHGGMDMKTNEGTIDRALRILAGLVLIALTLTGTIGVWGWIGVVPIITGALGWCPAYTLLGISTCPMKAEAAADQAAPQRLRQQPLHQLAHAADLARRRAARPTPRKNRPFLTSPRSAAASWCVDAELAPAGQAVAQAALRQAVEGHGAARLGVRHGSAACGSAFR